MAQRAELFEAFGNPLAVDADTDANDRILMLFTPVVNRMTPPGAGSSFVYSTAIRYAELSEDAVAVILSTGQTIDFRLSAKRDKQAAG